MSRQNGPDLRRDYDLFAFILFKDMAGDVRMDLIYEGITTMTDNIIVFRYLFVRMDLIYEGITTLMPKVCR